MIQFASRLDNLNESTIDQIKTAHQLISNYIEIDSSKLTSYYYFKTLSPIIESCITVIEDPIDCKESSSKWKEITLNLIDNDMIVTIKDKETIDWLSDIETGGCSNLKIRDAFNSKLNQMKLDFSSSELLKYARIIFKQIVSILNLNKELWEIHILHTHDTGNKS
ncbi:hypothetical protein ACTFIT_004435 [Dictyostelium discoideum]